jgi:hypothetical protein
LALSSFKLIFLFLFLILLNYLPSDLTRANRSYSELNRNNFHTVNLFFQLSRKFITKGTYHLTLADAHYDFLRSSVYCTLDTKLMSLKTKWNNSNSFKDYEVNRSELLNIIAPLIPYLCPQNENQKELLRSYKALTSYSRYTYKVGYVEGDYYPEKGPIDFSGVGGFALDAHNRSVGVDLVEAKKVSALRLSTYTNKYRIRSANLSLWYSNDNRTFFKYQGKLISYFNPKSILIDEIDIVSRYLKVNCNFKDANYTFADDLKNILIIYAPPF